MLEIGFMKVGGGTSFLKMFKIKKVFKLQPINTRSPSSKVCSDFRKKKYGNLKECIMDLFKAKT